MATSVRRLLVRTHVWLGWIVGVQLFLWTVSGLVMTAMPIEEVRGAHLSREPAPLRLREIEGLLPPEALLTRAGPDADDLMLTSLAGHPVYRLLERAEVVALLDARSGQPLRLDKAAAAEIAAALHAGPGRPLAVTRVDRGRRRPSSAAACRPLRWRSMARNRPSSASTRSRESFLPCVPTGGGCST